MLIQHELDDASVLQEMTMTQAVNWFMLGESRMVNVKCSMNFFYFRKLSTFMKHGRIKPIVAVRK
jgi:hypothetical protein